MVAAHANSAPGSCRVRAAHTHTHGAMTAHTHGAMTAHRHTAMTAHTHGAMTAHMHTAMTAHMHTAVTAHMHTAMTAHMHTAVTAHTHTAMTAHMHTSKRTSAVSAPCQVHTPAIHPRAPPTLSLPSQVHAECTQTCACAHHSMCAACSLRQKRVAMNTL